MRVKSGMKMLKEQMPPGTEWEKTSEGGKRANNIFQPECLIEQEGKRKRAKRQQQHWKTQWQTPHSAWGAPQQSEATTWDDSKAFLASFEQVATACGWPCGEWVARLLPALSGEAQEAFSLLSTSEQEDYGQVKAAILRGEALRREKRRQHFRQFCCSELIDPQWMYCQVQELCSQWLTPEKHSKEQILELLVLEQFVDSLPGDIQSGIWAGGPENGAQAVALLEDILMRQREAETRNQQGFLKEEHVESIETEEPTDTMRGQISKEIKQTGDTELNLLGSGMPPSSSATSSLPPEQQEMSRTELNEGTLNLREYDMSVVEQTLTLPDQQVQEEDGGNLQSLKGYVVPTTEPEKEEDMSVLVPGQGVLTQQDSGGEEGSHVKTESIPWEEVGAEETVVATAHCSFQGVYEMQKWGWKSRKQCGQKPVEEEDGSGQFLRGFPAAVGETSSIQVEREKPALSGWKQHYKAGFAVPHTTECPTLVNNTQQKCSLNEHSTIDTDERHPESEVRRTGFIGQVEERAAGCPESEKSIGHIQAVKKEQGIPTLLSKRYACAKCGKHFRSTQSLTKHHKIHTGEKKYGCSVCGKRFFSREPLKRHRMIHTGEKPFTCTQCGKCFRQRVHLMGHLKTHYGEKSFRCPECGMNFSQRNKLICHQIVHPTQRPPKCRKSLAQKERLRRSDGPIQEENH